MSDQTASAPEPDEHEDPLGWFDHQTEHHTTCPPEHDTMRSLRPFVVDLVERINSLEELLSEWSATRPTRLPVPDAPPEA